MGLFTQAQQANVSVQKQQSNFLAKTSFIAGLCFAIVFGASFLLSKYWLVEQSELNGFNLCYVLGTVSLVAAFVMSLVLSFRYQKASSGAYLGLLGIFTLSYTFTFACFFTVSGEETMFYALAYTAIALLLTALVAWKISDKTANVILRISMWSFGLYFAIALIGSLIIVFTVSAIEWYWVLTNVLIGVAIISSNIYSFYQLKKVEEFTQLSTLDSESYKKLVYSQATSLLLSIIQTFILILRLLLIFGRE